MVTNNVFTCQFTKTKSGIISLSITGRHLVAETPPLWGAMRGSDRPGLGALDLPFNRPCPALFSFYSISKAKRSSKYGEQSISELVGSC
jgi:hypothetical protein